MAAFISGKPLTRRLVGTEKHYLNKSCFLSLTQQWYFSARRGIKLLPPSLGLRDQPSASLVEAAEGHHLQPFCYTSGDTQVGQAGAAVCLNESLQRIWILCSSCPKSTFEDSERTESLEDRTLPTLSCYGKQ